MLDLVRRAGPGVVQERPPGGNIEGGAPSQAPCKRTNPRVRASLNFLPWASLARGMALVLRGSPSHTS